MALKYNYGLVNGTQVFAMSEGITTTTYNVKKADELAEDVYDGTRTLKIIKAGTPVPSNDESCIGLVFENWDVTDSGGPIPIALSGNINENYAPVVYTSECKSALKNINFLGQAIVAAAKFFLTPVSSTTKATFITTAGRAAGISISVTLTGSEYTDDAADVSKWIIGLPEGGWYVASATKSSSTVVTIVIKHINDEFVPTGDEKIQVDATEACIKDGSQPVGKLVKLFA